MEDITIEVPLFPTTSEMLVALVDFAESIQSYEIPYSPAILGGLVLGIGEPSAILSLPLQESQISSLEGLGYVRCFQVGQRDGFEGIKYVQILPAGFVRAQYERRPSWIKFTQRKWLQIRRSSTFFIAVTAFILSAVSIILTVLQIAGELGF